MRKALAFIVLIVLLGVLGLSSSERAMRWLSFVRYHDTGLFGSDKYRFGDLYGLTYLAPFRMEKDTTLVRNQGGKAEKRDLDLYILGDSYLYSYVQMDTANFRRSNHVEFRRWSDQSVKPISIRSSLNKKVLVIETVERNVWTILHKDRLRTQLENVPDQSNWHEALNAFLFDHIYHPQLEQNLDFTLFNLQIISPIKTMKSALNSGLFHRVSSDVSVSSDASFLYLRETIDSTKRSSSFYPIKKKELIELRDQMIEMNLLAKSKGFDEVLFVIIPNPVVFTKTEARPTNHLVQQLSQESGSRLRILDPTASLMRGGKNYFFKSDSHWNQAGARAWLAHFNQHLLAL